MKKNDTNTIIEMKKHLENILSDINKVVEDDTNRYMIDNIINIKLMVIALKNKITK